MKNIIIAGEDRSLFEIADCLKTKDDTMTNLGEYIFSKDELLAKLDTLNGNLIFLSEQNFGFLNSSIIKFFELVRFESEVWNRKIEIALVSLDERAEFGVSEQYISKLNQIQGSHIKIVFNFKLAKNSLSLSYDIKSQAEELLLRLSAKKPENLAQNKVTIYTDGACSGNPGAGGWGAILIHGESKKEFSGYEESTTNNKMELTAVIEALKLLKKPCAVELYSDSAYVVNAIRQNWLENWKKNNWLGADKKPVKNIELWQELSSLLEVHSVEFNKVKGHSTDELNNRCDALATGEISKHQAG